MDVQKFHSQHILHMETMLQPLDHKLSSVGTLLCITLQIREDLDGGILEHHISLPQEIG